MSKITYQFALRNKTRSQKVQVIIAEPKGGKWVEVPEFEPHKFPLTVDKVVKAFGSPDTLNASERIWVPDIDKVRRLLKAKH